MSLLANNNVTSVNPAAPTKRAWKLRKFLKLKKSFEKV
jgi:hypothetical protein